jgi:HrpA-like RNA helicase
MEFDYSSEWSQRMLQRGNSRSDRCERHRKAHRLAIQALAVPYIDLAVIGEVPDPDHPAGPLGSLGPLPVLHRERTIDSDLSAFEFGMSDGDVLQILEGLRDKQVAVIEAGTGTGKSTFMPFRLMNPPPGAAFQLSARGPIVVTEPRVAAAKGVARFVGEELCFAHDSRKCSSHIGPGYGVGYQVSGEKHWDTACQLIYVTDGTMINWVRDGQLSRIGAVIIDEAHERSENIDIILAQLRATVHNYPHLRVIITSATLDRNFFVQYFGGEDQVFHLEIPPTKTFGYGVPLFIDARIDQGVIASGLAIDSTTPPITFEGWKKWGPEEAGFPAEDLQETTTKLERLRCVPEIPVEDWRDEMPSAVAKQVVAIAKGTQWGDILSFLPTTASIDRAVAEINDGLSAAGLKKIFDVYPLLATTDKGISEKATAARSRGQKRKIVVSSNLAETSLTVKGVRYVVDSGLICQPEWDAQLASGSYPTKLHSQSGVRQRWGRVGRDAPGWVFPLYTIEQFLGLPRSTPPGSAQTNLESFYMKLISAGVNVEEAALPANFRHESMTPDAEALRVIDTFTRESARAQRALRLTGAVDAEGDLTEYGRDLERFPGTGSEALALMLAEQLACIHEVALALHVLGEGRLFGKKESAILQIDTDWPSAWRATAAQHHRGLAAGCDDDLDLLLHVCAAWQGATKPSAWCATWWVNEPALSAAWTAAMETVRTLSAAMKAEAYRQIEPGLAERARAVLTRAMVSLRYERVTGTQYRSAIADAETAETVDMSPGGLFDAPDRVLAFNRYRREARKGEARQPYISHIVRTVEWAEQTQSNPDAMGVELIVQGAMRRPKDDANPRAIFDAARETFPVGTLLDLTLDITNDPSRILDARVAQAPFCRPTTSASVHVGETPSGFDPAWDPLGVLAVAEVPEEERATQILDPRSLEVNDAARPAARVRAEPPKPAITLAQMPPLFAVRPWEGTTPFAETMHGRVLGYRSIETPSTVERAIGLVVEPLRVVAPLDPALHPDLRLGQNIEVRVCGVVRDYEREFLQVARTDGLGYFYLNVATGGLSYYDRTFLTRLVPGAVLTGVVICEESGALAITFLPAAQTSLQSAPTETLQVGNESLPFYSARICEPANSFGKIRIELEHGDPATGLTHQFEVRQQELRSARVLEEVDGPLLVALARDRPKSRHAAVIRQPSPKLEAFLRAHSDTFVVNGERIEIGQGQFTPALMAALIAFDDSPEWQNDVSNLFIASFRRFVRAVRPQPMREYITCRPTVASLIRERKRDIQDRYGVVLSDTRPGQIEIRSSNQAVSATAASALIALNQRPSIVAALPPNTTGIVLGKEHANRKRLEGRSGVLWVWVENDRVGVIGESDQAVKRTIDDIRSSVERTIGELVISSDKMGLLIGRQGATIKRLKDSTGCQARNPDKSSTWIIEGPSEDAVRQFLTMARQIAGGTSKIASSRLLRIVEDTTTKTEPRVRRETPKVETQPAKSESPCFIATACYGGVEHPDVAALRRWRDDVLLRHTLGRTFVRVYYRISPPIANYLKERKRAAGTVRFTLLQPMAAMVRLFHSR